MDLLGTILKGTLKKYPKIPLWNLLEGFIEPSKESPEEQLLTYKRDP